MKFKRIFGPAFSFFLCCATLGLVGCVSVSVETDGTEVGPDSDTVVVDPDNPCFVYDENTQQTLNLCTNVEPIEHEITIAAHEAVFDHLSNMEADAILKDATEVAKEVDEPGDIACNVTFIRKDDVQKFTNSLPNEDLDVIDTPEKFYKVRATVPQWVKMVSAINWCWDDSGVLTDQYGPLWGCADSWPSQSLFVVPANVSPSPATSTQVAILWLHELGHNKNNRHVNDYTRVMFPTITEDRKTLVPIECGRYHIP